MGDDDGTIAIKSDPMTQDLLAATLVMEWDRFRWTAPIVVR